MSITFVATACVTESRCVFIPPASCMSKCAKSVSGSSRGVTVENLHYVNEQSECRGRDVSGDAGSRSLSYNEIGLWRGRAGRIRFVFEKSRIVSGREMALMACARASTRPTVPMQVQTSTWHRSDGRSHERLPIT